MQAVALNLLVLLAFALASADAWARGRVVNVRVQDDLGKEVSARWIYDGGEHGGADAALEIELRENGALAVLPHPPRARNGETALRLHDQSSGCLSATVRVKNSVGFALPREMAAVKLCQAKAGVITVRRTLHKFIVELPEYPSATLPSFGCDDPGLLLTAGAWDAARRSAEITLVVLGERAPGAVGATIHVDGSGFHPIKVEVTQDSLRGPQPLVVAQPPVPVRQRIELVIPSHGADARPQVCVRYSAASIPEYMKGAGKCPVKAEAEAFACEVADEHAVCPLLQRAADNELIIHDANGVYEDKLSCKPEKGRCKTSGFSQPRDRRVTLKLPGEMLKSGRMRGISVILGRTLVGGASDTQEIQCYGTGRACRFDMAAGTLSVEFEKDEVGEQADTVYTVEVYSAYSNSPNRRNALLVVSGRRARVFTETLDAAGMKLQRFIYSLRAYSGASWSLAPEWKARAGIYRGAEPFVGAIAAPEIVLANGLIAVPVLFGYEAERERAWELTAPSLGTSSTSWRSRLLLGVGYRSRALPILGVTAEYHIGWAPEFVRRGEDLERQAAMLRVAWLGAMVYFDVLPRFAERLRLMFGVDAFMGSRSEFTSQGDVHTGIWRVHMVAGLSSVIDGSWRSKRREKFFASTPRSGAFRDPGGRWGGRR